MYKAIKLKSIAEIDRESIKPDHINNGHNFIGLENIDSDGNIHRPVCAEPLELKSNKFKFYTDHVLYGKLRPYLKKIARPDFSGICSTDILPIKSGSKLDKNYLFFFLRLPEIVELATQRCSGANLPRLSPKDLLEFEIPLPPLDIQKKIAAVLDKADMLRKKRKEAIEKLDQLIQSVFLEMFGDPVRNDKGWSIQKLQDISLRITKGESPKWQGFSYQNQGVRFITSENVLFGSIDTKKEKYIPLEFDKKLDRSRLEDSDLLINLVGASIGRAALVTKSILPANINQAVSVTTLDSSKILPIFVVYQILTPQLQKQLLGEIVEAARANISLINIRNLEVIVPPLEEQCKFRKFIDKYVEVYKRMSNMKEELSTLFSSLLHRAFRGELEFKDKAFKELESDNILCEA